MSPSLSKGFESCGGQSAVMMMLNGLINCTVSTRLIILVDFTSLICGPFQGKS